MSLRTRLTGSVARVAVRPRVLGLAVVLVLSTCTDERTPFGPRSWATPSGLVSPNPPALLVGAGDIGNCAVTGDEATALLLDNIPGTVFTAGDDAYDSGTDTEFANCYDPNWGRHKVRTRPSPGNHEYNTTNAAGYFNYFGAAAGEIGKGYYSYDLGDWHIIVLNSSGGSAGTNVSKDKGAPQELWLAADLAAHPRLCTLAYFHYPLYSSTGGTGTGGVTISEVRPLWDDLYAAGADLIVNGHRHFYERQAPQKPDRTADPVYGIRLIIAGTGGNGHTGSDNVSPNSEVRNSDNYGVLKLWLYPDSYAWKFVPVAGQTFSDTGSTVCHGAPGSGSPVSASRSTLTASPTSLTAGSGTSTITVTAKDANGSPMSGATVVLAGTGSGNTLTQPSGTTNASGVATGTLSSTVAEPKAVSATANGTAIAQTATLTVTAGAVSASQSMVTASPTSILVGTGTSTITATAKDANGNPVSGATVSLSATGTGNTLSQPSGTTNASGVATGILSSTIGETKTISSIINGTAVTQTATVTVTASSVSASRSTVSAAPGSITAGSGSSTIAVTAKDANGSPISGAAVLLSVTGSGNTLTQPASTTNSSGVAAGSLSSTVAESKTVSATANGTPITQTATVTVTASGTTVVLVGAGEVTRCDYTNDEETAQLLDNIPGTVFTTGDNVRASGTLTDFTTCYDPSWGRHRTRTRPAVGAKEYQTTGASGYFDYFGAAGGDRDKGYYSYDLGDWHVVVLNSNIAVSVGSAQEQWLRADLAASAKRCTLAYWNHPRFSSYSTLVRSSVKPLWDALYAARAEVVLNGHYRLYERFAPQTPDGGADPQTGIRQITVGTGGHGVDAFGTTVAPNSEARGSGTFGVLKLTLATNGYSWAFVPVPGGSFTDSGSGTCH